MSTYARPLLWTFALHSVMTTLGLSAIIATHGSFTVLPLLAALIGVIWLLVHDRRRQVEISLSLRRAVIVAHNEARLDQLTGVANRRAWEEAVAAARDEVRSWCGARVCAIAIADVDRLKQVNDTLGHAVGDALIVTTANALRREAPEGALIARLGGDEFGVLWVTTSVEYEASNFVGTLSNVMTGTDVIEQLPVASIGFASAPPHNTVDAAVEHADSELIRQKAQRRLLS